MKQLAILITVSIALLSCKKESAKQEEEVRFLASDSLSTTRDTTNSVKSSITLNELATDPQHIVMTGLKDHRLISIYKKRPQKREERSYSSYSYDDYSGEDTNEHYMPGIDLLFGYNLVNMAHLDMTSNKLNYLFDHPVLIKSVYYPSGRQDSVGVGSNRKPINRDYFLVSVFDEDTNQDTLLNKFDLRRFYHFNSSCDVRTRLLPDDYSVERSQCDYSNDIMFLYARQDVNKNGRSEKKEPLHVFKLDLKQPTPATRVF